MVTLVQVLIMYEVVVTTNSVCLFELMLYGPGNIYDHAGTLSPVLWDFDPLFECHDNQNALENSIYVLFIHLAIYLFCIFVTIMILTAREHELATPCCPLEQDKGDLCLR